MSSRETPAARAAIARSPPPRRRPRERPPRRPRGAARPARHACRRHVARLVGPDEALDLAHRRGREAHPGIEGRIAGLEPIDASQQTTPTSSGCRRRRAWAAAPGGRSGPPTRSIGGGERACARGRVLGDGLLGLGCSSAAPPDVPPWLGGRLLLRPARPRPASRPRRSRLGRRVPRLGGRLLLGRRTGLDRGRGLDCSTASGALGVLRLRGGLLLGRRRGLLGLRLLLLGRRPLPRSSFSRAKNARRCFSAALGRLRAAGADPEGA